jgi:serine/threonine protein kinase
MQKSLDSSLAASESTVSDLDRLVESIIVRWRAMDQPPSTEDVLEQYPRLRNCRALCVDLAYEEFCLRSESGESVDANAFAQRFPTIERSLLRQLEVHQIIGESPACSPAFVWPKSGKTVFECKVIRELGRGSLARVYLARQLKIGDRLVAVKIGSDVAVEASTLGKLDHPNIMPILSTGTDSATHLNCIVMPFLGESTLADFLRPSFVDGATTDPSVRVCKLANGESTNAVLRIAMGIAQAVSHAHDRGIVHGDLKPSNVLLTDSGAPLVLDFNLSFGEDALARGGTLAYMAPEHLSHVAQLEIEDHIAPDFRSDVFSFGALLYELLTRRSVASPIPQRVSLRKAAQSVLTQRSNTAERASDISDDGVRQLVKRCLAYDPADRPQSMRDVATELARLLSVRQRISRIGRKHRLAIGVVGAVMMLLAAIVVHHFVTRPPEEARLYVAARAAFEQGDYARTTSSLSKRDAIARPTHEVEYLRGVSHLRRREHLFAYRAFQGAVDMAPCGRYYALHGYAAMQLGHFDVAERQFGKALDCGYATIGLHNNLAVCLLQRGAIDEATPHLDEAIRISDSKPEPRLNRALAELKRSMLGRTYSPEQGLKDIAIVAKAFPQNGGIRYLRAMFQSRVDETDALLPPAAPSGSLPPRTIDLSLEKSAIP